MGIFKSLFGGKSRAQKFAMIKAQQESERAQRMTQAALTQAQDSEGAKLASDARLRKLGLMRGLRGTAMGRAGGGTLQGRQLMGS